MQSNLNIDFSKIVDTGIDPSFYRKIFDKIINYIENNVAASFEEIINYVGGGERRVIRLLDQMVNLNILTFQNSKFYLYRRKKYKFNISDMRCRNCDSKIVNINDKLKPLEVFMKKIIKNRPKSTFIFDQRPVNAITIIRRVGYMIWRGDLQNKRVAVIGDDDLMSIALAKVGMAREIVVFDIDNRTLNLIKNIAEKLLLNIKTVKQDLLKDVPSKYKNHFDTFITDPTPTVKPLELFTTRGLQMLIHDSGNVGYISLYPSHMDLTVDFQQVLSEMNILITDLIPFFNQYEIIKHTLLAKDLELMKKYSADKSTISFYEYFMRIETMPNSKPLSTKFSPSDLIGKATKQVLKNPALDPVLSSGYKDIFIEQSAKKLRRSLN